MECVSRLGICFVSASTLVERLSAWKSESNNAFQDRLPILPLHTDMDKESFVTEMPHLPFVHSANFQNEKFLPLDLLNKIYDFKLQERFANVCICLRILLTLPATVASAKGSFSKL